MRVRLFVGAGMLGIFFAIAPVAPAMAATATLPDLKVATTTDFRIALSSSGRRYLRFSGLMLNVGRGPFEVRGNRASTKAPWIIDQIVYRPGGGTRRVRTSATMSYAGDGHDHWHVERMLSYHLWSSTQDTLRAAKIGFCFLDTTSRNLGLPGAPRSPHYLRSGCGTENSLFVKVGISVGWADLYPSTYAYQWIDITGLPAGTYTVRGAVDLYGSFVEASERNNCTWTRISFKATGPAVKLLATGTSCVNDHDTSPNDADIDWAVARGIASDCDADMFCTYDPVTRGQLASFVARAMDLPASTTDHFTDDDGSVYEADIDRVAAAGIMGGCTATTFCPNSKVTRGALATVLAAALALPPTANDYFSDDETSTDEASINAVAEAGIMAGCTATTFCPTVTTRRGETMGFLHRAFPTAPTADAPGPASVSDDPIGRFGHVGALPGRSR